MKAKQVEHIGRTPLFPVRRIGVRLAVALLSLAILDLVVRARSGALEASFFGAYRLPDVRTPPLDEFSDAIKEHRKTFPRRIVVGLAGPSNIWGHWLTPGESIPARLEARLRAAGYPVDVFNLAMVRNRYSDDRAEAAYFAGAVDFVLVPYAQFQIGEQCPSHPEIIEWSGRIPESFGEAPGCRPIARHRANAVIEDFVRSGWATYRHRNAIRHLVFPHSGDFGRAMFATLWSGLGVNNPKPLAAPQVVPAVPGNITPITLLSEVASEVNGLCHAYAANDTRVLFYRFPADLGTNPTEVTHSIGQIKGFEAFVDGLHASEPRCGRLETVAWSPGPMMMFDAVHPTALGADRFAAVLADAVIGMLEQRQKSATGATP
jgi:hypothetical protein